MEKHLMFIFNLMEPNPDLGLPTSLRNRPLSTWNMIVILQASCSLLNAQLAFVLSQLVLLRTVVL